MAKFGCLAFGFLLASGSSGCLLYTDHINRPPQVTLTGDTKTTFGVQPRPRYHAEARDPDQRADTLTYEWRRHVGPCPTTALAGAMGTPVGESKPDFQNDVDVREGFCVSVLVRDDDGATAFAALATEVERPKTTAAIELVKPRPTTDHRYPLFSPIRLSGARSMDPEMAPLTFRWMVSRGGQAVTVEPCAEAAATDICFTADQPGEYVVTLTVKDSRGNETMARQTLVVEPDSPPCIRRTEPELLSRLVRGASDPDLLFEVKLVEDDGDPYPAVEGRPSTYSFTATWWLEGEDSNNPSGRRPADQNQIPSIKFSPNYFHHGDQVSVRFQVSDRVPRDFSACIRDKVDNCALGKDPACYQWVTWKIDFRLGREM